MPTLDAFGERSVADKDTIRMAPYADWTFPQVKSTESGDESEDKYPETLRTVGYIVKRPTTDRVRRMERLAVAHIKSASPTKSWNKFCSYIVNEIIVDWYDYKIEGIDPVDPDDPDENTPWEEAKEGHLKLFRENIDLPGRFLDEYGARYAEAEKKTEEDLDGF